MLPKYSYNGFRYFFLHFFVRGDMPACRALFAVRVLFLVVRFLTELVFVSWEVLLEQTAAYLFPQFWKKMKWNETPYWSVHSQKIERYRFAFMSSPLTFLSNFFCFAVCFFSSLISRSSSIFSSLPQTSSARALTYNPQTSRCTYIKCTCTLAWHLSSHLQFEV